MKRTLTPDNVLPTVANLMASSSALVGATISPKISTALREKIFLAVTSVNDCRYCKWGHSRWAMAKGVPIEEVNQILGHEIEALEARNAGEAAAILFAQHYAEQLDQIDPASIENLRSYYDDAEVAEILAYVRFITLTNLTGNTVDAYFDRLRGRIFESSVATLFAPLAFMLSQVARFDRQVGMDELRADRQGSRRGAPMKPSTRSGHAVRRT
jgi:AhpD family alkylhydroperoxidase